KCILPKASDLAVKAYNAGWLKPSNNKKKAKITGKEFLKTKVSVPELAREGIVKELIADPEIFSVLWKKYASTIIKEREKEVEETIRFYEDKMKVSAGKTEGKKKYGQILKSMKRFSRSLDNLISGGGFLRRLFRGKKEIKQVIHEANVAAFPGFSYHPKNFTIDSKKMFLKSKSRSQMNAVIGDFQQLITIYASIWITESKYIDYLEDKLFWKGVMQQNGERNTHDPLEKRILSNLKTTSKKKSRLNQKQIIRRSIEEAIVPVFNENIRFLLDESFAIFTDDQLVKYDSKKKEWYIPILTLDLPKSCVKRVFTSLPNVVVKKKNEQTEIRFLLADFESSMKAKDAQTIETFLRCSVFQTLNKEEFKALDFFGELNERYIGKSTANRFFSNIKHLAQMILSPSK
ncbi:MAG: hypothetical protein U9O98_08485, partial [Asgard group archaeon]|nr:hypothetical protein [Asgard group archaeon]